MKHSLYKTFGVLSLILLVFNTFVILLLVNRGISHLSDLYTDQKLWLVTKILLITLPLSLLFQLLRDKITKDHKDFVILKTSLSRNFWVIVFITPPVIAWLQFEYFVQTIWVSLF